MKVFYYFNYIFGNKYKPFYIFLSTFSVSMFAQLYLWRNVDRIIDKLIWMDAINTVSKGGIIGPDSLLYGYPAFTIISIGKFLLSFGFDETVAIRFILIFFLAIGTAGICCLAYIIKPSKPWWFACLGIIIFSPYFENATPPSIIIPCLISVIFLIVLLLKNKEIRDDTLILCILGFVCGLALSTRIDISAAVCFAIAVYLIPSIGKRILIPISLAFIVFSLFAISFQGSVPGYFIGSLIKSNQAFGGYFGNTGNVFLLILDEMSLVLFSVFLGVLIYLRKSISFQFPRSYFVWLFISSLGIIIALLFSSYHPQWYFIPVILIWELFIPLFLFTLSDHIFGSEKSIKNTVITWSITVFVAVIHLSTLIIISIY
jgi:hypothetical protein